MLKTFWIAAFSLIAVNGFGQTMDRGRITGTVTDPSGAVVTGATVTAKNLATAAERSVQTNDHGLYTIPAAQIGTYQVTVTQNGFKTATQENVHLDVDSTVTVNVSLQLGSPQQSVVVTETPPAVQTENGEMGTLATGAQVNELAFNGRNFSQILTLGTGVSSTNTGHRLGVGQEGNPLVSVNGGRVNSTRFTFDGVIAMDTGGNRGINLFPPLDAIDEVQISKRLVNPSSGSPQESGYWMDEQRSTCP